MKSTFITPELTQTLSQKSDKELMAMLENPEDWMPQVLDFARTELHRRSVSTEEIDRKVADAANQKAEELQLRATEPLSTGETFEAVVDGILGLLGLLLSVFQASRYKTQGFLLKSRKH